MEKVQRRAAWLNDNVFADKPISDEVVTKMIEGLPVPRAMELFKEVEEKADSLNNPSGYLDKALRCGPNRGAPGAGAPGGQRIPQALGAPFGAAPSQRGGGFHQGGGGSGQDSERKVIKRAEWLNMNVFVGRPIDDDAVGAMIGMGVGRAMELFKDIETKNVNNPSGYLKAAARREGLGPPGQPQQQQPQRQQVGAPRQQQMPQAPAQHRAPQQPQRRQAAPGGKGAHGGESQGMSIAARAVWLNSKLFVDRPIDDEAVGALCSMGSQRAQELLSEVEQKSDTIRNPTAFIKTAAKREGQSPPVQQAFGGGAAVARVAAPRGAGKGQPKGGGIGAMVVQGKGANGGDARAGPNDNTDQVRDMAFDLNTTHFVENPISDDVIEELCRLESARGLDILRVMEEKAPDVRNPNGYLSKAVQTAMFPNPAQDFQKVSQRARWLNQNVLVDRPFDEDAVAAMVGMGVHKAMELCKHIEENAASIQNPSGWVKNAAKRAGLAPPEGGPAAKRRRF